MAIILFNPEAWASRTTGFPRLVQSILFDISLHNWRTGTSMSLAHYRIITSDLSEEQALGIADMLHGAGKIEQDDNGIWSPDAIEEWSKAEILRQQRARGGSSSPTRTPRAAAPFEVKPVEPTKPEVKPAPPPPAGPAPAAPTGEDDAALAKIEAANKAREALNTNIRKLAEAWNVMALKSGLPEIKAMSDKRKEQSGARIREHGIDAMLKAVEAIPASDFLMGRVGKSGWMASFDFILQPSSCLKLIEGTYHQQGEGTQSGWR